MPSVFLFLDILAKLWYILFEVLNMKETANEKKRPKEHKSEDPKSFLSDDLKGVLKDDVKEKAERQERIEKKYP